MRKTNLFGATMLALAAGAMPLTTFAQTPATTPAPAAAAPAAPAPAPAPAPAAATPPPADVTPTAPATDTTAPAPASDAKPKKMHAMHSKKMLSKHPGKGKLAPTKAGDKAVEDLNDASLNSAKTGKAFTPPTTPEAAKKEAHMPMHSKKMMHHMAKKKAMDAKPADAAAPATPPADSATPPADSSAPK